MLAMCHAAGGATSSDLRARRSVELEFDGSLTCAIPFGFPDGGPCPMRVLVRHAAFLARYDLGVEVFVLNNTETYRTNNSPNEF